VLKKLVKEIKNRCHQKLFARQLRRSAADNYFHYLTESTPDAAQVARQKEIDDAVSRLMRDEPDTLIRPDPITDDERQRLHDFARDLYDRHAPEKVPHAPEWSQAPVPVKRPPAIDPDTSVYVKKLNPMTMADHWGYYDGTMPIVYAYHINHQHFIEVSFDRTTMMWFSELLNVHMPEEVFAGWIPVFVVLPEALPTQPPVRD
jgi:hypothetical protein